MADLGEIVRLYGLRMWVEQGYKQVKGQLGWADFQVRSARAILRHLLLVCCAFSFCWHATHGVADPNPRTRTATSPRLARPPERPRGGTIGPHPARWTPAATWPIALRRVRGWLTLWRELQRLWRAWSTSPPPPAPCSDTAVRG